MGKLQHVQGTIDKYVIQGRTGGELETHYWPFLQTLKNQEYVK